MKQLTSFTDWSAQRDLENLNEAYDPKDIMRIRGIVDKSKGSGEKIMALAKQMANTIKDAEKATRRAEAAEDLELEEVAEVFHKRAEELRGGSSNGGDSDSEEQKDDDAEETPRKEKGEPKPRKKNFLGGDFLRITGEMVKSGKVQLGAKGGWRVIQATGSGNRGLAVDDPKREKVYTGRMVGYGRSRREAHVWRSVPPSAKIDLDYINDHLDQGIFYVKVLKPGGSWLEGIPMFFNGLDFSRSDAKIRIKKSDVVSVGPELEIIQKNLETLDQGRGISKFFMGDEPFVMTSKGDSIDEFVPGSYVLAALNFELTVKEGSPIVYCVPSERSSDDDRMSHEKVFFAPIEKCLSLPSSITEEQGKVVAEYMSKVIGANIESKYNDESFSIPWFLVHGGGSKGYPGIYYASPFFTREKAEAHIEELREKAKSEKFAFNVDTLKVAECPSYQAYSMTFPMLMEYASLLGVGIKMRKFVEDQRGAITAKKFGF